MKYKLIPKKFTSVLLAFCMILSLFTCAMMPVSAAANDGKMLSVNCSSQSACFFGYRSPSGGFAKNTKYRFSLDWENIEDAPFGNNLFNFYCYSGGWKVISSSNLTTEWSVSSYELEHGTHYDIDFTTSNPTEMREFVLYFGDINKDRPNMKFKTANWVLYTRDANNNLTDTGLMPDFDTVSFRDTSDNAMNNYISSYTATDKGQIWRKYQNGYSSLSSFTAIPFDYFAPVAPYENVMQVRNAAGQNVYQILGASNFAYGNSYAFSIDMITRKTGETTDPRVRVYSAIGAGGAYREETLVREEDSNTYTCTFAYQFSGSGDAFKVWIGTYDAEDNIVVANPELYLLDAGGYKIGQNLILDPGFTTGVHNADHSTAQYPWFSDGTATGVSVFSQPENYFAYDPTADYDTDTPKMALLRNKAWMFLYQEVASGAFTYGARYQFAMDVIHVRKGTSGGAGIVASTLDTSGNNWVSQPLSREEENNRYSCVYTHQSTKTSGTAFQVKIYTQDVDDFCILGNPERHKVHSSGNKIGENLIKDPGFHTGINPSHGYSEENYPWFSSNYSNVSNTEYCAFVKQPDYYFNMATDVEPDPTGTAPQKNMLRVESNGYESLVYEPYLAPGKTYRFTYNRKYFGNQDNPGDLVLRYRNVGGLAQLPDGNVTHYNDGNTTVYFIGVPSDAKTTVSNFKFRFYFGAAAGNTVYLGNLDLRELDGSGNPTGNNLIANSAFYGQAREVDTAGSDERGSATPAMWSYWIAGTFTKANIVKMPENFFSNTLNAPKKAIKVTGSDWSCVKNSLHLEANTKYQLSYTYKYDTHAPRISMQQVGSESDVTALSFDTAEAQDAFRKTHTFTMGSDLDAGDNYLLRFWLAENDCATDAYWYDIELYALNANNQITGKNLLDNGDFAVGNAGKANSLFGWEIEGAPFDSIELVEVPSGFFTYYSPAQCLTYLTKALLDAEQSAIYITLDRNKDGTVNIIDLIRLKKYYAYTGEDNGNDIPTDWYTDGKIGMTLAQLNQILATQYVKPKNIILMIGDGMGPNDVRLAEENSQSKYDFGLLLNKLPNTGFATTRSASNDVTDSAAGGTALATGYKTNNGYVGVSPTGVTLKNLSEYAREAGKKVGIVTNDSATGATPACFGAHVDSRGSSSDIAQQIAAFAPDVMIGQDYADFSGLDLSNFVLAQDFADFRSTLNTYNRQGDKKFMGFINYNATYSSELNILSHCTEVALNCLSKNSPNGFFLMVENTTTDNAGHANYINGKLTGVVALDRALAAVLKFMKDHPDTLLVVTSDHETGGVTIPAGSYTLDSSLFTTTKHTNANVRTFALGYGTEYFNGKTVDNTDVGNFLINAIVN